MKMDNETYGLAYLNSSSTTIFPLFNDSDIFNIFDLSPCEIQEITTFYSSTGAYLAVPEWEAIFTAIILSFIIVSTVVGNILVILGVFTHKPLRIVQNFFIVSLAVADLAVAILVMPLNVTYSILGRWEWGIHLCKMWLTCDIMCCTSSILNLCAIALDRYWAITDPINYANKRTLRRVLFLIAGVWVLSLTISSPPLLGWNDWPDEFLPDTPCRLTSQQGYVIYSSLGSFFIPLLIMTIVYIKIFIATRRRLRERAKASQINMLTTKDSQCNVYADKDSQEVPDRESGNSESNPNENVSENGSDCSNKSLGRAVKGKRCQKKEFMEIKNSFFMPVLMAKDSVSEIRTDSDSGIQETNNETVKYSPARYHKNVLSSLRPSKKHKHEKQLIAKTNRKGGVVHQFIEEKQKISLSKERRAARTLGIIMGVFVVCWLPFFLMYVILPFCPSCCPTDKLINFITWLGYINSALNPLIYTIFNMDFRKAFKKLLGISR